MNVVELGFSPPCGPKAGSRVTVRSSDPVGAYALPNGLKTGDVVVLLHFDRGWWDAQRTTDDVKFQINILNLGEVLSAPALVSVPRDEVKPDWRKIVEVARETQRRLEKCSKPGQRMRQAYVDSYRSARALGYHGDENDWELFVRRRGSK